MNPEGSFQFSEFYQQNLVRPVAFDSSQLLSNKNQVAGHSGFFSLSDEAKLCLKPFNTDCVRGRREHLFYQLVEYYKKLAIRPTSENDNPYDILYYKNFPLLTYSEPHTKCNCTIDADLIRLLSSFVAKFYHVKHLSNSENEFSSANSPEELNFLESVYSDNISCPCYGRDPKEKSACSRDYVKKDFLCLEDLTSHCQRPCIIDIKIGQITYDPMAIKEKVVEQSSKYKRLREFGFRILGMKQGGEVKDKTFGKTLETREQVLQALDSFFDPLDEDRHKTAVIEKILARLHDLLEWFENKNNNQLKFFSSSLLIVYDSFTSDEQELTNLELDELICNSVGVSMIDFAHVLHVHKGPMQETGDISIKDGKDGNYIYGLRMLVRFFQIIIKNYQPPHPDPHHQSHPHPPQV